MLSLENNIFLSDTLFCRAKDVNDVVMAIDDACKRVRRGKNVILKAMQYFSGLSKKSVCLCVFRLERRQWYFFLSRVYIYKLKLRFAFFFKVYNY